MKNIYLQVLIGIFQESHYDMALFNNWLKRHPNPENWLAFQERAVPRWSPKARVFFFLSHWISCGRTRLLPHSIRLVARASQLPEAIATSWVTSRARRVLRRSGIRIIVGITGSYGKTTTKEILSEVLAQRFRVHRTPENVNTLLGVATWILHQRFSSDDVLIVEMGAYRKGDIARLCEVVRPTFGILAGINEAHLERFGNLGVTRATKSELFDAVVRRRGTGFWNESSAEVRTAIAASEQRWKREGITLIPYGEVGSTSTRISVISVAETSILLRIEKVSSPTWNFEATVQLLGEHHRLPVAAAVAVASTLGLSTSEIKRGLEALRPLPRRLEPSYGPEGRLIIDDSYNITLDGIRAAVKVLRAIPRRKIGVFTGIPEAGDRVVELNRTLGSLIAPAFQIILLRDSAISAVVETGLRQAGWNSANLVRYGRKEELDRILSGVLKPYDCVYFSAYDWPAIYL